MSFSDGFSLIELLIVLVVIGILSSIGFLTYRNYYLRGDLAEANARLLNAEALARSYFINSRSYIGFCATYPEYSKAFTSEIRFTCSEDTYCFRVRIIGSRDLNHLKSLVSETGSRTVSVPSGWKMPDRSTRCLVASNNGSCT